MRGSAEGLSLLLLLGCGLRSSEGFNVGLRANPSALSPSALNPSALSANHGPTVLSPKWRFQLQPSSLGISELCGTDSVKHGAVGLRASSGSGGELSSLQEALALKDRKYFLVGGKGGVGKTSTSSAIALKFADEGLRTLIISTDPAHSLGDALTTDLSSGKVTPISEQGGNLYALEVDLKAAVQEFKNIIQGLKGIDDENSLAGKLGLSDLTDVFDVVPPGADELVALSKVVSLVEEGQAKTALGDVINFDRIVIDTAPTGHTLRLLEYPRFISNLITKALSLRNKIDVPFDVMNQAGSFFASQLGIDMPSKDDVEGTGKKINEEAIKFRDRMQLFDEILRDPKRAEFVVVCIATTLSAAETSRLVPELVERDVSLRQIVVNQLLRSTGETEAYLNRLRKEQQRILKRIRDSAQIGSLSIAEVPLFDSEIIGVYALRALGNVAFTEPGKENFGKLFDSGEKSQFVFVGGKGGVGKTSTSSALGVRLADSGLKTLIISTDPAHSLCDALGVPLTGDPTMIDGTDGNLYAMQVDTEKALEEFKEKLRGVTNVGSKLGDIANKIGLDEFADILENPPPGTDEVVALGNVLQLVKDAEFDRVIVDTAPTGHTLRLLSFPDFLDNFLQKIISIKRRLDGAINAAKSLFGMSNFASGGEGKDDIEDAAAAVERLRKRAVELRELLTDNDRTQFLAVTIATELAAAESERLIEGLSERNVAINNIVVNQLLGDQTDEKFLQRIVKSQEKNLEDLKKLALRAAEFSPEDDAKVSLKEIPFFDTELRSVYALRALSAMLFSPEKATSEV